LVDLWKNSDLEFSQKVNAQNGTSHSSLQKTEKFALKFHSFLDESPREDRLPIFARNNAQSCSSINPTPFIG
jgi:hypothetical protein